MEKSNSNDSNTNNLIYCFICGIVFKQFHFVNHYRNSRKISKKKKKNVNGDFKVNCKG